MAPREVNLPEFPDTLPEDFAEWDGGGAPPPAASVPVKQAPAQNARPAPAPARPAPEVERPTHQPVVRAAKPAAAAPKAAAADQAWQPPKPKQSAPARADFAPPSPRAEAKLAEALWPDGEQKKKAKSEPAQGGRRNMGVIVGAVVVVVGLGAGSMLYVWKSHSQPHPQPAVASTTTIANPEPLAGTPDGKPDPRNATGANPAASLPAQSGAAPQANQNTSNSPPQDSSADTAADNAQPQAPPQNVNMVQFTAQSQIPRAQQQPSAPEPSGNLMMAGNSAAPMIGGSNSQRVQFAPSRPIDVSSAALTATRRTPPQYPEIARNSHVSGVVTVAIQITPQGTVADARAVSGPNLLRQPAVNAVKNWRFKPYMLNGHPVAVTSNVNVGFSIQ